MVKLYLVNCEVIEFRYMDGNNTYERNHIVEANDEEEVYSKVRSYYGEKDNPYYKSYTVNINYVNEVIR